MELLAPSDLGAICWDVWDVSAQRRSAFRSVRTRAVIASFCRNSAPADDADGPESDSGSEPAASLS